jgi:hypothetical protein
MFEHRKAPLLSRRAFLVRLARHAGLGLVIVVIALGIGMIGYHAYEDMPWIDAFANAAMILSGMGPLGPLETDSGKIFAGLYALFSGLAFITIIGIVLVPVAHRFLHKFHLESVADQKRK